MKVFPLKRIHFRFKKQGIYCCFLSLYKDNKRFGVKIFFGKKFVLVDTLNRTFFFLYFPSSFLNPKGLKVNRKYV